MPTIRRCCIIGCDSNSRDSPSMQFFAFPREDSPYNKIWKQACQASLSRILPFKKPVVCALHFPSSALGGRRLIGSAVPSLGLEVPHNLKMTGQQTVMADIERSRKCAYINAVVYEWLVRANLNPQLRGSITHGMIKEKAETARQIIGSDSFVADNRWLNRFRETHLANFSQKLSTNQLKPMGPSLWIPEIVQDLSHLYPPASPERISNLENVPDQYINYMHQYGEHAEEEDPDSLDQSYGQPDNGYEQKPQMLNNIPYNKPQITPVYQQQQREDFHNRSLNKSYNSNGMNMGTPKLTVRNLTQQRTPTSSPLHMQQRITPPPNGFHRSSPAPVSVAKRPRLESNQTIDDEDQTRTSSSSPPQEVVEDLTDGPQDEVEAQKNGHQSPQSTHSSTSTNMKTTNGTSTDAERDHISNGNGQLAASMSSASSVSNRELSSYAQALEYLKPLEEFALFKENFRAIGLISQLENILRKGNKTAIVNYVDE